MARDIYCRWCDWPTEVVAAQFPARCEHCHREARWTTQAPALGLGAVEPLISYELTPKDRSFLSALKIQAE